MNLKRFLLFVIFVQALSSQGMIARSKFLFENIYSVKSQKPTEILMQGFGWDSKANGKDGNWYVHMAAQSEQLKDLGITHIWFPPVSRSVSKQGYMPGDYYDLGSAEDETFYGSEGELKEAIEAYHKSGIQCIADIVINHRTASHQENGVWNVFHHKSGKMLWEKWALANGDYGGTGAQDSGGNFEPAPDIDHSNLKVRQDIKEWLNFMKNEIGFDGWRFDFVKGYSGTYAGEYTRASGVDFAVGEYWSSMGYAMKSELLPNQDPHRQLIVDWVDATKGKVRAFDFTTKGILQEALKAGELWRLKDSNGRQSGVMGWWPERTITFIDNHDTGSKQAHWPFPEQFLAPGYAYILTHPGTPTIFWEHWFDGSVELKRVISGLSKIRHELGIHRESELQILEARQNLYVAELDHKLLVKLGSESYKAPEGFQSRLKGFQFEVFVKN